MKFFVLYENVASIGAPVGFMKVYSSAPTGKLDLSASPGTKGLQPVSVTRSGISGSFSSTVANGKRASKTASSKRGKPKLVRDAPLPEPGAPKTFHSGTGPSRIFAVFPCAPFTHSAA